MDKPPFGPGHGAPVQVVFWGLTSMRLGTMGTVSELCWEKVSVFPGFASLFLVAMASRDFLITVKGRDNSVLTDGANYMLNTFAPS